MLINNERTSLMARQCQLSKKKKLRANNVSHSKRRTNRFQSVNLQWKRVWDDVTKRFKRIRISAKTLKFITGKSMTSIKKHYKEGGL